MKAWESLLHLLSIVLELFRRNKDEAVGESKALKKVSDENQKQREKVRSIRDDEPILDFLLHPDERTAFKVSELRADLPKKRGGDTPASGDFREDGKKQ